MLNIKSDGTIQLTRGDSARLTVSIANSEGTLYEIQEGDSLTLSVKKTTSEEKYSLQKTIQGSTMFRIDPQDTKNLAFGRYKYDVQLTLANGDVYTVVSPSTFEILQEVTV